MYGLGAHMTAASRRALIGIVLVIVAIGVVAIAANVHLMNAIGLAPVSWRLAIASQAVAELRRRSEPRASH